MPTYQFLNSNTNEVEEHIMKIAQYDEFKQNNPHLERYFSVEGAPVLGDGMRMSTPGIGQADSTFEKYIINRMKETIPGNTMKAGHKTKMPREW
jgi:hypothetical protein